MLIQKLHPGIRLSRQPSLAESGNPLFSRQGHWDGGSTLHCVAMALALIGKVNDPVWLPYHGNGPEQILWDDAWPRYLTGLTLDEFAGFVAGLNLGVRPATCTDSSIDLLRFVERELQAGWPVVVGWQQWHRVKRHAALIVRIEGPQNGRAVDTHALLLLDPAGNEPALTGFNARVDGQEPDKPRFQSGSIVRKIRLLGAVSIRNVKPAVINAITDT